MPPSLPTHNRSGSSRSNISACVSPCWARSTLVKLPQSMIVSQVAPASRVRAAFTLPMATMAGLSGWTAMHRFAHALRAEIRRHGARRPVVAAVGRVEHAEDGVVGGIFEDGVQVIRKRFAGRNADAIVRKRPECSGRGQPAREYRIPCGGRHRIRGEDTAIDPGAGDGGVEPIGGWPIRIPVLDEDDVGHACAERRRWRKRRGRQNLGLESNGTRFAPPQPGVARDPAAVGVPWIDGDRGIAVRGTGRAGCGQRRGHFIGEHARRRVVAEEPEARGERFERHHAHAHAGRRWILSRG